MGRKSPEKNKSGVALASGGDAGRGGAASSGSDNGSAAAVGDGVTDGPLGPAVTADFLADAGIGLQDLIEPGHGPSSRAAGGRPSSPTDVPTPVVAPAVKVEVDERMILKTLQLMDSMISAFAGVASETAEELEPLTAMLKPLADYYATDAQSVTMLWVFASIGVAGYGLTKYQKYRAAHPKLAKDQPLPMKAADGSTVTPAEVATPPGAD